MKKKTSLLLLAVFAIFLGIVILHPLSHSLHHHDDGHECPICFWLHYVAVIFSLAVVFYVIFRVISFIAALPGISLIRILLSANISLAPPEFLFPIV